LPKRLKRYTGTKTIPFRVTSEQVRAGRQAGYIVELHQAIDVRAPIRRTPDRLLLTKNAHSLDNSASQMLVVVLFVEEFEEQYLCR
jgi:hypothetical protein